MRVILALGGLALLAACGTAPSQTSPEVDLCQAAAYQGFVGQSVQSVDDWLLVQHPYRVIRPGDAVTEDYSPSRLNIWLDGADRIARVDCG